MSIVEYCHRYPRQARGAVLFTLLKLALFIWRKPALLQILSVIKVRTVIKNNSRPWQNPNQKHNKLMGS